MLATDLNVQGLLPWKRQMALLAMPRNQRRRLLNRTARQVIRASKRRASAQTDLQGRAFAPHARRRRRKMLVRLMRRLRVVDNNGRSAKVGFKNSFEAGLAAKHQFGHRQTVTANAQAKQDPPSGHRKPATRHQAKRLREAGFTIKGANGKRTKKPSLKWITENLKRGQAGAILRGLREEAGEIKDRWDTVLPERSTLGATPTEVTGYINEIFTDIKQELSHAAR